MAIFKGTAVRHDVSIKDALGNAVSPQTVTLTLKSDKGTVVNVSPVDDGAGTYHAEFVIPSDDDWAYRWLGIDPVPGRNAALEGRIEVQASRF